MPHAFRIFAVALINPDTGQPEELVAGPYLSREQADEAHNRLSWVGTMAGDKNYTVLASCLVWE